MVLIPEEKATVVRENARHAKDSGSVEVQVALMSSRLDYLQRHFEGHPKDHHSRRGLLQLVGKRRRMLDYLKRTNIERYRTLIQKLGIRK